jgi:hypothetical protein
MKPNLIFSTAVGLLSVASMASMSVVLMYGPGPKVPPFEERWWQGAHRFVADGNEDGNHFGHCLALDGHIALVDAPLSKSDSVYLFQGDQKEWKSVGRIEPGNVTPICIFGESVALCNGMALVGKPVAEIASDDMAGAAYLYRADGSGPWKPIARLTGSDATVGDQFGNCVALEKGIAFVGTIGQRNSGAVYIFREDTPGRWRECGKLVPDVPVPVDSFGWPIAVGGDLVVIGAHCDRGEGQIQAGAAYVFQRNSAGSWKQLAKLTAPDSHRHEYFGHSVAVFGDSVLVGAPGYANGHASAYLFRHDNAGVWKSVAELTPHGSPSDCSFGHAIAMNDRIIAVGAPLENKASGAVYLFNLDNRGVLREVGHVTLPGQRHDNWFGVSMAVSGDTLLVGAQQGGGKSEKSGAAYLFHLGGT